MSQTESQCSPALNVDLGARSYPIYIGPGLLGSGLLRSHVPSSQVAIVTNETIRPLYGERVARELADLQPLEIVLPDGERYKNLDVFNDVLSRLLERGFSRSCTLVALGGGVIGDLCGFVAASYMRGVRFIQVPTTLLSQVDSSVGGKTAVNHALGKNMIGAFHQPSAVIADIGTLDTLPAREVAAGLAEVIKYGLIRDPAFFAWLEEHMESLVAGDPAARIHAVRQSCINKAAVVAADETEQGVRALLNLGHTFGHAIETAQSYQGLLHGEAVAVGMRMAAELSCRMGHLVAADCQRIIRLLERAGLPVDPPEDVTVTSFQELMLRDKKTVDGNLRLILLRSIGEAYVCADVPAVKLQALLEDAGSWRRGAANG